MGVKLDKATAIRMGRATQKIEGINLVNVRRQMNPKRPASSGGGGDSLTRIVVLTDIDPAEFNGVSKKITPGVGSGILLTQEVRPVADPIRFEWDADSVGILNFTGSSLVGSTDVPVVIWGRRISIAYDDDDSDTYYEFVSFDLASLSSMDISTSGNSGRQAPWHPAESRDFQLGQGTCE